MPKLLFKIFIFTVVVFEMLYAKAMVDCRVMTGTFVTECNPYGHRLQHIKEVIYDLDRKKLIIVKTLPKKNKKRHMQVISVNRMLEKYLKSSLALEESILKHPTIKAIHYPMGKPQNLYDKGRDISEYTIAKGDSLSKIAEKLNLSINTIVSLNSMESSSILRIGKKLRVPYSNKVLDALLKGSYTVEKDDTLLSIAKIFKLSAKEIVAFNDIKDATTIRKGKVLKLPLPYIMKKLEDKQQEEDNAGLGNNLNINAFGIHKLRVTATAYTSHGNQTDDTPFLAAWNNHIRPGMKIIAVSRDLLTRFGMDNGTKVRIGGLKGYYRVRDKMNKRYRKRIDIYMGVDLKKALRWGKQSVMIYW